MLINLLYGNSENTEYDTGVVDISKYSNTEGLNEAEVDGYFKKSAIDWVANHPIDAAGLYLQKVANYFNFKNKLGTKSEESLYKNVLMFLSYYPLLIFTDDFLSPPLDLVLLISNILRCITNEIN